ncbi:MAG: TonB-dependent receptor [Cyclobacteriaceae bacterium]
MAQTKASGVIRDSESGEPLIGATVLEKGSATNGTITDIDGKFDISVQSNDALLAISYAGYRPTEVKAGTDLSITLEFDFNELEEVVVIGYGSQKKSDLTGSMSGVKSKTLMESQSTDVFSAMQGRMAGVQITTDSGQPGAGMNLRIRGQNSISGISTPLFVIDGVQIDVGFDEVATTGSSQANINPLTAINPADIESIEVLKDASATAIFGSRGANGVVIVTTKSGANGRSSLDYTYNITTSEVIKKMPVLSAQDYITYQEQRGNNEFLNNGITGERRNFDEIEFFDYQEDALRTSITHQHQLSLTGSSGTSNYAAGIGVQQQEGIVINNDFDQYNMRLRVNNKPNEKVYLRFNTNGSYSVLNGIANNGGPNSFTGVTQQLLLGNPWNIRGEDVDPFLNEFVSPLDLVRNSEKTTSMFRLFANVGGDYKFNDDLTFTTFLGTSLSTSKAKEFYNSDTPWGLFNNGEARVAEVSTNSFNHSSQLQYNKSIGSNHELKVMAAYEITQFNWEQFRNIIQNFQDQSTGVNDISRGTTPAEYITARRKNKRLSYFTRVNYTLLDKYLFTATFRADGTDRVAPGSQWGFFPSVAFAWRVSDEAFMSAVKSVSNLKLRLSYGETGNEAIPPYVFLPQLGPAFYSSNDELVFGLAPTTKGNDVLTWETTRQLNSGIDIGLIEGRFNIAVDYYKKITTDLLLDTPIPAQSGFQSQFQNIGRIDNEGIEIQISTVNIDKNNFRWKTDFNITFNRNEVVSLGDAQFIPVSTFGGWQTDIARVIVGEQVGTMFGYNFVGVYQIEDFTWQNDSDLNIPHEDRNYVLRDELPSYPAGNPTPGSMKYSDTDGNGVIDDDDRQVIGQSNPVHFGGLNNTFSYKNFDLSVFFQWVYGNDLYNAGKLRLNGNRLWTNISQDFFEGHWTPENPSNEYPAYGRVDQNVPSSYFVEDGSFIRLRTVSFGYRMPKEITDRLGVGAVRFSVIGNNLLTWTNYSGWDPEVNYRDPLITGLDRIAYPRAKSYTFSINVTF